MKKKALILFIIIIIPVFLRSETLISAKDKIDYLIYAAKLVE